MKLKFVVIRRPMHRRGLTAALFAGTFGVGLLAGVPAAPASTGTSATFSKTSDWGSGFVGRYVITNNGTTPIAGWKLEFDLPAGASVSSAWSAQLTSAGNHYVLTNESWTRTIAPGASVSVGFQATEPNSTTTPTGCLINGIACDGPTRPPPLSNPPTDPPPPSNPPPSNSSTPSATFSKTSDWGSGFVGRYVITNNGTTPIDGWKLEFDLPQSASVSSAWSAQLTSSGNHYVLTNEDWTRTIAPGASVSVGLQATEPNSAAAPTGCLINAKACDGSGAPPPPPNNPPPPPSGSSATADITAPYVDMTLYPQFSLADAARQSKVKEYSLAFIVSGAPCTAAWGGVTPLDDRFITSSLASLRAAGGDAIVSFGGEANQELALSCKTVDALAAQYQAVIDRYGIRKLDFDIEGASLGDAASLQRRAQAVARIQAAGRAASQPVSVSLTLPAMPTGLTQEGVNALRAAIGAGVDISVVNVMAMDYFDPSLSYAGRMGDYAIEAATNTHDQLTQLYPGKSNAEIWKMVGVTPMLGINDDPQEVFTTADASKLANFAAGHGVGRLAMWSANRDAQCPSPSSTTSNTCSGVAQSQWAFSNALASGSAT